MGMSAVLARRLVLPDLIGAHERGANHTGLHGDGCDPALCAGGEVAEYRSGERLPRGFLGSESAV